MTRLLLAPCTRMHIKRVVDLKFNMRSVSGSNRASSRGIELSPYETG